MQIHELNNFTGTLGSGAYLAIDDGTDTGKISSQGLLAATEARIDNIIAGPAPSAEEIVDARLGADGVTYPSLGDAIRDQFTDVKSALNNAINHSVITCQKNIITFEQGGISISSGGEVSNNSFIRSMRYMPDDIYYVKAPSGKKVRFYCYDKITADYKGLWTGSKLSNNIDNLTSFDDAIVLNLVNDYNVRIVVLNSDLSNIEPSDAANVEYYTIINVVEELKSDDEMINLALKGSRTVEIPSVIYEKSILYSDYSVADTSATSYITPFFEIANISALRFSNKCPLTYCAVVFYDSSKSPIYGVNGNGDYEEHICYVPDTAKYVRFGGSKYNDTVITEFIEYTKSNIDAKNINSLLYGNGEYQNEIVSPTMKKSEFITAYNSALSDYQTLCLCAGDSFRRLISIDDIQSWEEIYKYINANFRYEVANTEMSFDMVCERINYAFTQPIRRFCDAKLNTGTSRDFSLSFSTRSGEPSLIVSEDRSTLYCYSCYSAFRVSTTDGINWSEPEAVTFDTTFKPEHGNVNLIDGVYYFIAPDNTDRDLRLWTSIDGLSFTYQGMLFNKGHDFGNNEGITLWGNSFLIKENGMFWLYIEAMTANTFWQNYLTTCTDILNQNEDGTIGNWIDNSTNPILGGNPYPYSSDVISEGNVDFARGEDNRLLRVDGQYKIYYHVNRGGHINIWRASSADLRNWELDGPCFNNRDIPTAGDSSAGNADHAIIQFKGRTYLFYTWDINNPSATPYIKYTIDDRPILEMMKLKP